jgi:hypothetical protein
MNTTALTNRLVWAASVCITLFGAGFLNSVSAGSEPVDNSKEKMIQPMAPVCDPRWYVSFGLGIDFDTQVTSFVNGTTFEPFAGETNVQEHYKERSWNDAYDNSIYRVQGELGYVLTPHIELFGLFKYEGGYGKHLIDRDVESGFQYPVFEYPGLYRSWGGELGLRYYFFAKDNDIRPFRTIRPYVSISGGASYVDHIGDVAQYGYSYSSFPESPAFKGTLYNGTVVGTGALMIGAEVPLSCHWSLGLEAGLRYQSELDGTDVIDRTFTFYDRQGTHRQGTYNIGGSPGNYNDAGDRLSVPVTGYIKFRF